MENEVEYVMLYGTIIYKNTKNNEDVFASPVNAVAFHDQIEKITAKELMAYQGALQTQFHKKNEEKFKVIDVIICNIIPLGKMTRTEFENIPELKEMSNG